MSKKNAPIWSDLCERNDTCALTGAASFVAGIKDAVILANGPLWCYFYALRYLEHAVPDMARRFLGSQPDNNAVVYGSEKYILEALQRLQATVQKPSLLFIESSCSMSLIGDDLAGIAKKASLDFPTVTMDCGGMVGGFAEGYVKAAISILRKFLQNNVSALPNTVNILGVTDFYLHGNADTKEISRILKKAGYHVHTSLGSNCSLDEIKNLGQATLNIVINEELGLPIAKYLQENVGTPYILAGVPYGVEGSWQWLEKINEFLPAPCLSAVQVEVEEVKNSIAGTISDISCLWGNLWYEEVFISAPPTIALCLGTALRREWADMNKLTIVCQHKLLISDAEYYCSDANNIYTAGIDVDAINNLFKVSLPQLVLASSSETLNFYRQKHNNFQKCNIAFPSNDEVIFADYPFAGLQGSKNILQILWNNFIGQCLVKQENL